MDEEKRTLEQMVLDEAQDDLERQAFREAVKDIKPQVAKMVVDGARKNEYLMAQAELRQEFLREWYAMPRGFHTAHARSELISKYRRRGLRNLDT